MYIARDDKRSRGVAAVVVGPTGELVSAKTTHFRGTVAISSVFSTVTAAASSTIPDHSVAVAAAAAAAAVTGWEDVPDGCHVRTLDETDFLEAVGGDRCVLVFFHARCECSSRTINADNNNNTYAFNAPACRVRVLKVRDDTEKPSPSEDTRAERDVMTFNTVTYKRIPNTVLRNVFRLFFRTGNVRLRPYFYFARRLKRSNQRFENIWLRYTYSNTV